MARTELTPQDTPGRYPSLPLAADEADLAFDAGDAVNGNEFALTGREIILARNDDAGAQTLTISSVDDQYNRDGDISAYSIGAGEYAVFGPIPLHGFRQSDGMCYLDVSDANIKIAIIRIPS